MKILSDKIYPIINNKNIVSELSYRLRGFSCGVINIKKSLRRIDK